MSDKNAKGDVGDDGVELVAAPPPRSRKKLMIVGAAVATLLIGGGGAAYFMMGSDEKGEQTAEHSDEPPVYVEVPPMTVNLRSADGQPRYLKLRFVLVPATADQQAAVEEKLPLILDALQPFLRELRPEDLAGSAAVFRLKEEMVIRATSVLGPDAVRDVLIQDLIQQ